MKKNSRIYIAGHNGMVGSSIYFSLKKKGYRNLIVKSSKELDLTNQKNVSSFFTKEKPEYVFLAAAKVGGILANNTFRAQFIYENLQIQNNVIHESYKNNVKKLLFLGSSCIYPKFSKQPIKEEYLLTNLLEKTNEPYAIAKISGIKMCEAYADQYGCNFISVMPTNLYGPNDNFDLNNSHVLPAIIRKLYLAKCLEDNNWQNIKNNLLDQNKNQMELSNKQIVNILNSNGIKILKNSNKNEVIVNLWGSGLPKREFLHVDDLSEAAIYLMLNYNEKDYLNVGCGEDISIKDLAYLVKNIIGFDGLVKFDSSKLDGTPRKLLDVSKLFSLGWKPKILLDQGIKKVYEDVFK